MNQRSQIPSGQFFLPGPTEVSEEVAAAQTGPMIGHRGPEIKELVADLQSGLKLVFQTDRPVVISTSSATGLMEAAVRNGVAGGKVLSMVNGAFSSRFADISEACGHRTDRWEVDWGEFHDPGGLEDRLESGGYQAVTLTHSETSTGVLQDLESIARIVGRHDDVLLLVDSVTGIAGAPVLTDNWGLDFVLTGSQKALALPPGLSFGVASQAMMDRSALAVNKGYYFDLIPLMKSLDGNQTPSTPAVSLLYSLQAQLRRVREEGMEARWARHEAMRQLTEDWVSEMSRDGTEVGILAPAGHRSPTITCITLPKGTVGPDVVGEMRELGWVIGGGYGKTAEHAIRIGHMGDHDVSHLASLLATLGEVLS
jgi:aspartate aminotransferase-like enzyme